jgi:ABC-type antimicrobial peptide transport system permease subunit
MLHHLHTALRNIWKQRATNTINITGLAAGMTSAILIFLWVTNELTYDNYHPDADRIYRTTTNVTKLKWTVESAPLPLVGSIRNTLPGVETVTCLKLGYNTTFHMGEEFFIERHSAYVDSSWFTLFHYEFLEGGPRDFFRHPFSLILTRSKAKQYFGSKDPIGQTLRIDTIDYKVAGIIRDIPANSSFQFDVLMPVDALLSTPDRREYEMSWNYNYQIYLKLRPDAQPRTISAAITAIQTRSVSNSFGAYYSLIPLKDIHFETDLTSQGGIIHARRSTVTIFSILGAFLLVIACINYVNLTTARAAMRAKEVGIRKIVGAGKTSLFLQFLTESLLISSLALLITIGLVYLSLPAFRNLTDKTFPSPFANTGTWTIIGFTLLAATALNGVYPALLLSSFRPLNVLRGATILKFKDVFLRKGLVVLQFTFSVILIAGTLIIQRQLDYVQHADPGYNRSQVFSVSISDTSTSVIKEQLLEQSSVAGVTIANQSVVNITNSNTGSADWDGRDTSFRPTVSMLSADEDYKKVMQLQMAQGRWFDAGTPQDHHKDFVGAASPRSSSSANVQFVLNETAVNTFNLRKPVLGQRMRFQRDTGEIIGVVKDFHFASLHEKIQPIIIRNRDYGRTIYFVRSQPGQTTQALAAAHALATRYSPSKPFNYTFLDDQFDALYKADQKVSTLILLFSAIAILISCLGLFALAAFTAQQRIKEVGIRKVLGATVPNIIALLSRDFVRLVGLSILIATPIAAWAMHNWLEDFAYHIALSAGFFIAAGLLALLIAILTVSTQSIKAATANPAKSLRTD